MSTLGSFIWSIADHLRGPYRPNQYGNVILPLTILRRLDCIIEPDREKVRELATRYDNPNRLKVEVKKATGRPFYNTSNYSFANLLHEPDGLADNLADYIDRFSPDVDVFEYFDFKKEILALEKAELLGEVITSFNGKTVPSGMCNTENRAGNPLLINFDRIPRYLFAAGAGVFVCRGELCCCVCGRAYR